MNIIIPKGEDLTQTEVDLPKVLTEYTEVELEEGASFLIEDLTIPPGVGFRI